MFHSVDVSLAVHSSGGSCVVKSDGCLQEGLALSVSEYCLESGQTESDAPFSATVDNL